MLVSSTLTVINNSINKYAISKQGVDPFDLCFFRSFALWLFSIYSVFYNNKHVINGIDPERIDGQTEEEYQAKKLKNRRILCFRAFSGTIAYTSVIFSVMYVPIFVFAILRNTSAFFIVILGWLINGESVSKTEGVFIMGSFTGITYLILQKDENVSTNNNITLGVVFSLMTAFFLSIVIVATRKLKEIHYSIMIFWYSTCATSFYIIVLVRNYCAQDKKLP